MDNVAYTHACNSFPAPPITIWVNNGAIFRFEITHDAVGTYSNDDIRQLFEAAGLSGHIIIPIPDMIMNDPILSLRFSLKPGIYEVKQIGQLILLPEDAFLYTVDNSC